MTTAHTTLDDVFSALSNEHRREIVLALGYRPHSISSLAEMRGLSLPAIHKHVTGLEQAGFVQRRKVGRTNYLALRRDGLRAAQTWLAQFHTHWGHDDETLDNFTEYLTRGEDQ